MRYITLGIGLGVVAGMAMATAAISNMYPDVPRRMMRDGRRAVRCAKHTAHQVMRCF